MMKRLKLSFSYFNCIYKNFKGKQRIISSVQDYYMIIFLWDLKILEVSVVIFNSCVLILHLFTNFNHKLYYK